MGFTAFLLAAALGQSPAELSASAGLGSAHAGTGTQLEARLGPVSLSAAAGTAFARGQANFAGGVKLYLPGGGWYAFASWAAWMDQPPRTEPPQAAVGVADRWHVMSAGVGYRLALEGDLFADVAVGFPRTCGRYWFVERFSGEPQLWSWSCHPFTAMVGDPIFTPDFSLSVGYTFAGRSLGVAPASVPAPVAAGIAGAVVDALSFGLLAAAVNLDGTVSALGLTIPALFLTAVGLVVRPIVVAVVASIRSELKPSALFAAVLTDLVGGALIFAGLLAPPPLRWAPPLAGFAVRTVATPWIAASVTAWANALPPVPVAALRF